MSNKKVIIILSIFLISFFSTGLRAASETPLTVTINQSPSQADPTGSSPIYFEVIFSASVNDFASENVTIGGTAGATTATVTGSDTSGTTYNIAVSGMTSSGIVTASIDAGKAHDAAGNPNTASSSTDNMVTYDITAPTVTITSTATSPTKNSPIPMTATFSEAITGFSLGGITVGNGAASNLQGSGTVYTFDVTPSGQGTVTVDIPAGATYDEAGNGNTAATQFSVIYDSIQPTVAISSPSNNELLNTSTVAVSGTASDADSGLQKVEVSVDGGAFSMTTGTTSWSFTTSALSDGIHTITAKATDNAGNSAETSISITVDTALPSIAITSPSNNAFLNTSTIAVSGTASKTGSGVQKVEVSVDGGPFSMATGTTSWSFTTSALSDGTHTITAKATDNAGNINQATVSATVDSAPSTVAISSPSNNALLNTSTVAISGTASDTGSGVQKVEVSIDDGAFALASGTTSWSFTTSVLSDGIHTITSKATDNAGNINQAAISISVDASPPAITITSPAGGQVFITSSIKVSGTASDNTGLSKVEIKVGIGDWQPVSGTTSWNATVTLSEGSNTIYAQATDTSGNTQQTSIIVTLDTAPPDSVSNPQAATAVGSFYINNTWVNPPNTDFSYVLFKYSNDTDLQKVYSPADYLNLQWQPHYTQNISAQTVDKYENINPTLVWFNATIPNNPPVQAPIGDKEVYKGQLLTFGISTTDADSDTITYGTNATKGSLNSNTGVFTWTPGDSDAGEYIWEFNSSDGYSGVANETIRVTVKNPLEIDLKFSEPYIINDNGTWTETWRDAGVGHIGKFIGINHNFKNIGNDTLTVTKVTRIYTNKSKNPKELYPVTDDNPPLPLTLAKNESKSCPDIFNESCGSRFEIDSTEIKDGFYNFTMQINVTGYNDTNFIFSYSNITTVSIPITPISRIKQADASIVIVSEGRTTTITYTLEANSTVNLTNVSISDPFYPQKYFNISKLEAVGNASRCYDERQNPISCSLSFKYPVTTQDISKFKSEESKWGYPYIINMATLTAKNESGYPINDTDYVKICVNKCYIGFIPNYETGSSGGTSSSSGGGGGGGGMALSEDINNIERREIREMDVLFKTASTYVFRSADPVMVVAFESSVSENEVPVAVEVLKNRSKSIKEDAPGKPYKYFNVFVGTSGFSRKVSKGVIAYRVNNSWLKENDIDPGDISLYKWRGTWVKLDTEIVENRSNYTYYASLTGNFSSFAIVAAKEQKTGGAYVLGNPALPEEQPGNITQEPANFSGDGPKHEIPGLSAAVILVFGITGIIFHFKRNYNKSNKMGVRK